MKLPVSRLLILLLFFSFYSASAQDITGIWRGYFITTSGDQYKLEMQVEQNKANRATGVTYSYLSTVFYGKATATGFFNKSLKTALIQEIKTVELKMSGGSVACIMKYSLSYTKSGNEEFLEGTYTSKYEKSNVLMGVQKGGNCGGGKVFLRKVITSDFYVEPFLRDKPTVRKPTTTQKPVAKAPAKNPPVTNKPIAKTTTKPPAKKPVTTTPNVTIKKDTTHTTIAPVIVTNTPPKKVEQPAFRMPATTRSRENSLTQTLNIKHKEVLVKLYDNGEIDGDTISVYLDNKLVLANKRLSASPISLTLTMDETNPEHTLVMVAENMGTIPPNTSLMIVNDGDQRYEVRITSTEQKNAMVRFRFVPGG